MLRLNNLAHLLLSSLALVGGAMIPCAEASESGNERFLTGPQAGEAEDLATAYLSTQHRALGLTAADITDVQMRDHYLTTHNGVRHFYWRQRHVGIGVRNGDLGINVARDGSIINLHHSFVPDLAAKVQVTSPRVEARAAVESGAALLGLRALLPLQLLRAEGGSERKLLFSGAGLSADPIPVHLVYLPAFDGASVHLAWELLIRETETANAWHVYVDADSGDVLEVENLLSHAHTQPNAARGGGDASYRVFPFPFENPDQTSQSLVSDPHDVVASPFGWHDVDGIAGHEFTDTRGNNVLAQEDQDADDAGGIRPVGTGSAPVVFDSPANPAVEPDIGGNVDASVINLFYWTNIMHDVTYQYGFDEAAGNFQTNNYGHPGEAADAVIADALDGEFLNDASFLTLGDGIPGRMQMHRWTAPVRVIVHSPAGIAGSYSGVAASFGSPLDMTGLTADLELVDDGVVGGGLPPGSVSDACESSGMPPGSLAGKVAVIDRGYCEFGLKVLNAQNAGAVAAIVVNNSAASPIRMGPGVSGGPVTIHALMLSQSSGATIKGQLPSPGVNATLNSLAPNRDSAFDAGIITHEYGHGVSNRLTGGPANASCLPTTIGAGTTEQAGEGWSDLWPLVLHAKATDTALTPRFIGSYSLFQSGATGPGLRNFPYSTDPNVSPQSYADVALTNAPHGVGEIWAGALWNLHWELVDRYGWDPDMYQGSGGNNRLIRLVLDGMKLQPCRPTMVQARDAILLADQVNSAGADRCEIWRAFAARGLGLNAVGGTFLRGDEVEDFSVPTECVAGYLFHDGFED